MSIYRIRGLGASPRPVKIHQDARDRASYAAARISQILTPLQHSIEGKEFWEDVQKRLAQIALDGEIA